MIKRNIAKWVACGLMVAGLAGCSSSTTHEPVELESIQASVRVNKLWSVDVGSSEAGLLSPAMTQTGLYAAGGHELTRIDPTTGKVDWRVDVGAEVTAGVGADTDYIAVGTAKGRLEVFGTDGARLWGVPLPSGMSTPPLVGGGLVIVRTNDTRVTAFDALTGERRWRYQSQIPALTLRNETKMIFSPAGVLVGQANGRLLALNAQGGTVFDAPVAAPKGITEVERLIDVVGAPMFDGKMICAAAYQGAVFCMDGSNGRPLWRQAVNAVSGPVSDGAHIYVTTLRGEILALDYTTGRQAWINGDLLWRSPSAVVPVGSRLVFGDYDGVVHVIDSDTGEFVGRTKVNGAVNVSPIRSNNGVIVQTESGEVAALSLEPIE